MAFKVAVLLSIFMLIYILTPLVISSENTESYRITLLVYNLLSNSKNLTFNTDIKSKGILLGAMKRIQAANKNFRFTIKEDLDYGPFLVSVNGVAGNNKKHTYWKLLVKPQNGTIIDANYDVGCYRPNPNETVILKFAKW
ncbi:hypothetical protein Q7C36_016333 [Tachysurus vachellii]|uniref:DUF4430 domain-containing protein n=1 Tax=Tachysurus vachellii TaxID=175792 RepID=A0AA88M7A9_TACVA|nr:hypothetical protein Q7C36_016333 [Tachysurus vachellii]